MKKKEKTIKGERKGKVNSTSLVWSRNPISAVPTFLLKPFEIRVDFPAFCSPTTPTKGASKTNFLISCSMQIALIRSIAFSLLCVVALTNFPPRTKGLDSTISELVLRLRSSFSHLNSISWVVDQRSVFVGCDFFLF